MEEAGSASLHHVTMNGGMVCVHAGIGNCDQPIEPVIKKAAIQAIEEARRRIRAMMLAEV